MRPLPTNASDFLLEKTPLGKRLYPANFRTSATDNSETAMAPKKKPALKLKGDGTSAIKKPAPKRSTLAGKESGAVAKKPPRKAVGKIPTAIKKETKKGSTKATAKTDSVINDEDISDKPAGNTRAATKKESNEEPSRPSRKTVTATSKNPKARSTKPADKSSAAAKEPTSEPVDIPSAGKAPPASPKRKRTTEDKWTEAADLPVPKSRRLDEGKPASILVSCQRQ